MENNLLDFLNKNITAMKQLNNQSGGGTKVKK